MSKLTLVSKLTVTKKTVKQYEDELQRLMTKLREKSVDGLEVVRFYERVGSVRGEVEGYLVGQEKKN